MDTIHRFDNGDRVLRLIFEYIINMHESRSKPIRLFFIPKVRDENENLENLLRYTEYLVDSIWNEVCIKLKVTSI